MKAKKLFHFLLAAIACFSLCGCMESVELAKMGIVVGMGIDRYEEGYLVTLQIINPAGVTGSNPNLLPVYSVHIAGSTLLRATEALSNASTQVLYYSHLKAVVIDEDIVREDGINTVMDFLMRNPEVRPDITVLVSKGTTAKDVLNVLTAVELVPMAKLDAITNLNRQRSGKINSTNLYELMDLLHTDGANITLNMVSLRKEEEHLPHAQQDNVEAQQEADVKKGEETLWPEQILPDGSKPDQSKSEEGGESQKEEEATPGNEGPTKQNYGEITASTDLLVENLAVFKDDKMVGELNSMESQYYNLLLGKDKRFETAISLDDGQYYLSLLVTKSSSKSTAFLKEKKAHIDIKIRGELLEGSFPMDVDNPVNMKEVERKFSKEVEDRCRELLKKTQEEFQCDITSIGLSAYYHDYKEWRGLSAYWNEIYSELEFDVDCTVDIYSTGEIKNYHNLN